MTIRVSHLLCGRLLPGQEYWLGPQRDWGDGRETDIELSRANIRQLGGRVLYWGGGLGEHDSPFLRASCGHYINKWWSLAMSHPEN